MISIVLPSYNGEKYITESVESVIAQTYEDWELIIVDDFSTDSTGAIADKYASSDPRIRVIHNSVNKKLPASLNVGFRLAKGEYYTWTSDDNIYYPNALEEMKTYLDGHYDKAMVCCGMDIIDADGNITGTFMEYERTRMFYNNCVGACFLYRRVTAKTIGEYNENLFCIEDYEYWLRLIESGNDIVYIDRINYGYRMHNASLTYNRWNDIKTLLNTERVKKFDFIFENLYLNERYLSGLYFDMIISDACTTEMEKRFEERFSILKDMVNISNDKKKCIIYGAGDYGDKTYWLLKERVAFYADRNRAKIGKRKNDIQIISLEDMYRIANDYHIVIALESSLVYDVATEFFDRGVTDVTSFQHIMKAETIAKKRDSK